MLLAFDLAKMTGVCVGEPGTLPTLYRIPNPAHHDGERWENFSRVMEQTIARWRPTVIGVEGMKYRHVSQRSAAMAHGLNTIVQLEAHRAGLKIEYRAPTSTKKFVTGNGRAHKHAVIKAVRLTGLMPRDDNEADAAALWLTLCHDLYPDSRDWLFQLMSGRGARHD